MEKTTFPAWWIAQSSALCQKLSKTQQLFNDVDVNNETEDKNYRSSDLEKLSQCTAEKRAQLNHPPFETQQLICKFSLPFFRANNKESEGIKAAEENSPILNKRYGYLKVRLMTVYKYQQQSSGMAFLTYRTRESVDEVMCVHCNNPIQYEGRMLRQKQWLDNKFDYHDKLIVSNAIIVKFNHDVTEDQIRRIFTQFGRIKSIEHNYTSLSAVITFVYSYSVDKVLLSMPLNSNY
ncbi:unnamed protein product [Didymodactylos carnosus]|uniref:RRM domain-containing protein n=1 Tax=Didymodactylos carnosus TaxID=1234261 RepID=A0A814HIA9_9BILA|nr:unnamed protein product [Didymodactylos carnosus]CAF1009375.1 unnamed protein product [Didymodactylos carnosus]CAF3662636.1 unnamed protein product [Didymodactylos carnosus]CAF3780491.1 unnamed protein product [Didymodactylos carnosus]